MTDLNSGLGVEPEEDGDVGPPPEQLLPEALPTPGLPERFLYADPGPDRYVRTPKGPRAPDPNPLPIPF
jgi:hypothetical protein